MNEDKDEYDLLIEENNQDEIIEDDYDIFEEDEKNETFVLIKKIIFGLIFLGLAYAIYTTYKDYSLKKHSLADFKIEHANKNYSAANNILNYLINDKKNPNAECYKAEYNIKELGGEKRNFINFTQYLNSGLKQKCDAAYIDIYDYLLSNKEILMEGFDANPIGFQELSEVYSEYGMTEMTSYFLEYYLNNDIHNKERIINQIINSNSNIDKSYYKGKIATDPNSDSYNILNAFRNFEESYNNGNKRAAFDLGKLYFIGYKPTVNNPNIPTIEKNYNKATSLINESIVSGNYDLAYEAGEIFYNGKYDTSKNYNEAIKYYEIAIEHNKGMTREEKLKTLERLTKMYYSGQGTNINKEKASKYYEIYKTL